MLFKKPVLIIKAGTTFPELAASRGDFEDWTIRELGLPVNEILVLPIYEGVCPERIDHYSGVIITGAHAMVTQRRDWSVRLQEWLADNLKLDSGIPVLGICYGHQLLTEALGGKVDFHPSGREVGTVSVFVSENGAADELFSQMPRSFAAHVTHQQTAIKLPAGACVLAGNKHEAHHAVRYTGRVWGVQFHPEFNKAVMRWYFDIQKEAMTKEGLDVPILSENIVETPESASLLAAFGNIIKRH